MNTKVPKKIQKLRNARLNAVQGLYMFEQSDFNLHEILNGFINGDLGNEVLDEDYENETENFVSILEGDTELLSLILNQFAENHEYVDEIIKNSLDEKWSGDRTELVLKNIIRAGVTEIIYRPETDIGTIINEYIGLTDSFYQEGESKVVHALLHKIGNTLR